MKSLTGIVTSTKMNKSAVVTIESRWQHPVYKKTVKRTKKYTVHDPLGVEAGQQVTIIPTRPVSKTKKWTISEIKKQ